MTDPTMALLDCLSTLGLQLGDDLIRAGVRTVIQVAIEVRTTGERAVLGFAVWSSEELPFWLECLRSLRRCAPSLPNRTARRPPNSSISWRRR